MRNSDHLANLADELDMLRSQWEATNKNYRVSGIFDFETNAPVSPGSPGTLRLGSEASDHHGGHSGHGGLNESLANWRRKLDEADVHPQQGNNGTGTAK